MPSYLPYRARPRYLSELDDGPSISDEPRLEECSSMVAAPWSLAMDSCKLEKTLNICLCLVLETARESHGGNGQWNVFSTHAFYAVGIERSRGRDDSMAIRRVVLPIKRAVSLVPLSPRLSPFRVVLPIVFGTLLVLVCLVDVRFAAADEFTLTFTGGLSGTGSMTTDGICSTCTKGGGLLTLTINLGSFSGASAFDIVDDFFTFGCPCYDRSSNSLDAPLWDLSESPGAQLVISPLGWEISAFVGGQFLGTYAISPAIAEVPEPNTFALLVTAVGLLGFMIRGKTYFACAIKDSGPREGAPDDSDEMPFVAPSLR